MIALKHLMGLGLWRSLVVALALALALSAGPGHAARSEALPPLVEDTRVQEEFLAVAVGDEIRKNCSRVSARIFYVLRRARELEAYVLDLGYTVEDIEVLRKTPENKERLKVLRDEYLAANGVTAGDSESYCRLGRQEIEKKSLIGSLLWAL